MHGFRTFDDIKVKGTRVLIRVDINVPYNPKTKEISDSERLKAHAETLRELSERNAKTIVLAHQGRKGDPDFISLEKHAVVLSKHTGIMVDFINDIIGQKAAEKIEALKEGEILLLDNVRFLDDETIEKPSKDHSRSMIVKALSPSADIYVNDAFSVAHRSHASVVGFTHTLPSAAGRVMEREVDSCAKALNPERPNMYILGGAKPKDCLEVMKKLLKKGVLDKALACGVLGQMFLKAMGYDLGIPTTEFFQKKGLFKLIPIVKEILDIYPDEIEYPQDLAYDHNGERNEVKVDELPVEGMIKDIGKRTVNRYLELLRNAETIVVKGPAGVYEERDFEWGTRCLLEGVRNGRAFTLIGGGDTSVALNRLGISWRDFSHVSIAGGAFINCLSGRPLPGVEALVKAAKQ